MIFARLAATALFLSAFPRTARAEASAIALKQCYQWALSRSESLKIRGEDIEQSRQNARAALGGAFPKLDWQFTDVWQDPKGVNKLASQGFSGFIEKEQPESKFTLRQPLFSGLKEFSALSGFRKESARDELRLRRAQRELFETTVRVFYGVLAPESERDNTRAALALAQDRVKELQGFLRLGKARQSEVFTAQARAAALKASLRQTEARIGSAREELSFLTGQDLSASPLADELDDRPALGTAEEAIAHAQERADVKAQEEDVAAQEMRVRYEKGSYWPSLDLIGNYYTKRATFMREINWDVALALDVPLFNGGKTSANAARAVSAYRQSVLALEELKRSATYLIRRIYGEAASSIEEARAQEEAAQAAQKSYDSLREEYRLGLVTNIEVLEAMDQLLAQRNARDEAKLRTKVLYCRLGVAAETLP